MKLVPYLHFQGNCEEALNHYKKILNGTFEVVSRYDEPSMQAPENYKDKVLHGLLRFSDNTIMVSDVFPGESLKYGTNTALSLAPSGEDEAKRIFNGLAEGGKVEMPLEKQFWGALFGQLIDRFGVRWMVNAE